jgi:hypothetical protein
LLACGANLLFKIYDSRLRKYIFSAGNTIDPAEGYRAFRVAMRALKP